MIIDSSALVAILKNEPEARAFTEAIVDADDPTMSAAGYLETGIVLDSKRDPVVSHQLDSVIAFLKIQIADVTHEQATVARRAHADYGRRSGSPAKLNFGDCFSYALAKVTQRPLLFKGDDFGHTDITPAIEPQSRT